MGGKDHRDTGISEHGQITRCDVDLSVVVPVFGCANCLSQLVARISTALDGIGLTFEIVLVDDCSPDGAWREIVRLAEAGKNVRGFRLSRNFGQHPSIVAGVSASRGRWIAVMDGDLQDPPEVLVELYDQTRKGVEVVVARRRARATSWVRHAATRAYNAALRLLGDTGAGPDYGTFSLMSRKVADAYLAVRDLDRKHLLTLRWLGSPYAVVEFERAPTPDGNSGYTFHALVDSALQGFVFHSAKFLRLLVYGGFAMAIAGVAVVPALIALHVLWGYHVGWAGLAAFNLVLAGGIITVVGIVGLHVDRVLSYVRERPLYVVAETTDETAGAPERTR